MNAFPRAFWGKLLLWFHLFICIVWLCLFHLGRVGEMPPAWMWHVLIWSVLGIQFTWGFTVGYIVGPGRKRRPLLWGSLLTIFMPLYFVAFLVRGLIAFLGLPLALVYLFFLVALLACETYGGVLLGARAYEASEKGR
jgi:hypothetical protein